MKRLHSKPPKSNKTHVPTHSKNSVALIPIARSSSSTPMVTWGSTSSGIADSKSFEDSVATLMVVNTAERLGDPTGENPLVIANKIAMNTDKTSGLLRIVDIVLLLC